MTFRITFPLDYVKRVTQEMRERPWFYERWFGKGLGHEGADYGAPVGTPILAAAAGTVEWAGNKGNNYGIYVTLKHVVGSQVYRTDYAHMLSTIVKTGFKVAQGQVIGYVGLTGLTDGPHLHFNLRKEGAYSRGETPYRGDYVDPELYYGEPEPLPAGVKQMLVSATAGLNVRLLPTTKAGRITTLRYNQLVVVRTDAPIVESDGFRWVRLGLEQQLINNVDVAGFYVASDHLKDI